jgi:hypothetical protein
MANLLLHGISSLSTKYWVTLEFQRFSLLMMLSTGREDAVGSGSSGQPVSYLTLLIYIKFNYNLVLLDRFHVLSNVEGKTRFCCLADSQSFLKMQTVLSFSTNGNRSVLGSSVAWGMRNQANFYWSS